MLSPQDVERAVALQRASFAIVTWMTERAALSTERALHTDVALATALRSWLTRHEQEIPPRLRPEAGDVAAIANLVASYLETTFAFDAAPRQRLYSPDAHCFCPMCSWMVALPKLRPRALTPADKRRAQALRIDAVRGLATGEGVDLGERLLEVLLEDPALRDAIALVAYARDLMRRIEGVPTTPATLALWRGFAWKPDGSPRKGFALTAEAILAAEQVLIARLRAT
jgi:hypothetical protein